LLSCAVGADGALQPEPVPRSVQELLSQAERFRTAARTIRPKHNGTSPKNRHHNAADSAAVLSTPPVFRKPLRGVQRTRGGINGTRAGLYLGRRTIRRENAFPYRRSSSYTFRQLFNDPGSSAEPQVLRRLQMCVRIRFRRPHGHRMTSLLARISHSSL
jgi:hypothetical protein